MVTLLTLLTLLAERRDGNPCADLDTWGKRVLSTINHVPTLPRRKVRKIIDSSHRVEDIGRILRPERKPNVAEQDAAAPHVPAFDGWDAGAKDAAQSAVNTCTLQALLRCGRPPPGGGCILLNLAAYQSDFLHQIGTNEILTISLPYHSQHHRLTHWVN